MTKRLISGGPEDTWGFDASGADAAVDTEVSVWRKLHNILRGRYHWAILLALVGMAGGSYLGWESQVPIYRAEGLVYIAPSMPSPDDPAGTSVLPMFQGFVAYQLHVMEGSTATQAAMETDEWKGTGEGVSPAAIRKFVQSRKLKRGRGAPYIQVAFEHEDPETAFAGLQAILTSYEKIFEEQNRDIERLEDTQNKISELKALIKAGNDEILTQTSMYGSTDGLKKRAELAVDRVMEIRAEFDRIDAAIHDRENDVEVEQDDEDAPTPIGEIAVKSPWLNDALGQIEDLEMEEARLSETLPDGHRQLRALRDRIAILQKRIDRYVKDWNRVYKVREVGTLSLKDLKASRKSLESRLKALTEESRVLGSTLITVGRVENALADNENDLRRMERLEEYLRNQQVGKGRLRIEERGRVPTSHFKDGRISHAAAGGIGGAGLGVFIVLLLGLLDRRIRSSGGLDRGLSRLRLLGLIPFLPRTGGDPVDRETANIFVHQIRTLLQIGNTKERGASICVTGPGVESGKTTLSKALAHSFAQSGCRTLVVDADLTGRGMTIRVAHMLWSHARNSVANEPFDADVETTSSLTPLTVAQTATELPTAEELVTTLKRVLDDRGLRGARESGVVDDVFALADLLHPGEVRDQLALELTASVAVEGALRFGAPSEWIPPRVDELTPGRGEFNGHRLDRYVFPTGTDGLRFLPLRGLGRGSSVSVHTVERIMERVRSEFDVVLVDTGPVPGTVETSMVAATVDSVVVVLSPEDDRPEAERAVAHLEDIGANIAGVVFNRAEQREVEKMSTSQSLSPVRRGLKA